MSRWTDVALAILAEQGPPRAFPAAADSVVSVVSSLAHKGGQSTLSTLTAMPLGENIEGRADIVSEGAHLPGGWTDGFARLKALPVPRGVNHGEWSAMLDAGGRFLKAWGSKAAGLGWGAAELFGLDRSCPMTRLDRRGAAFLLIDAKVVAVTAETITLRKGGGIQRVYRREGFTVPAWENSDAG